MHRSARTIVTTVLYLLATTPALAGDGQATANRQMFDLSLEDLLQMTVITASRTEEELRRSTSVMSVIRARDIERAGFRNARRCAGAGAGVLPHQPGDLEAGRDTRPRR
jgi:outer membrane cobalamin receptor